MTVGFITYLFLTIKQVVSAITFIEIVYSNHNKLKIADDGCNPKNAIKLKLSPLTAGVFVSTCIVEGKFNAISDVLLIH